MRAKDYAFHTIRSVELYLDRYCPEIEGPVDVLRLFGRVERGKRQLEMALRYLFNYCEVLGYPEEWLNRLRKALPRIRTGEDNYVPEESRILADLKRLPQIPLKYQALYNLLLDSGLRLVEAVWLINQFVGSNPTIQVPSDRKEFYCVQLGLIRKSKRAFFAYFTPYTYNMILKVTERLGFNAASHYYSKFKFTNPKYIRKFVYDKMTDEELNIPDSIADFIQGRVPQTIGARHYKKLKRQADKFYPRYVNYLMNLRSKV